MKLSEFLCEGEIPAYQKTKEIAKRMLLNDMDTAGKDEDLVHKAWSKACKQTSSPVSNTKEFESLLKWFKKERDGLRGIMKKAIKRYNQ